MKLYKSYLTYLDEQVKAPKGIINVLKKLFTKYFHDEEKINNMFNKRYQLLKTHGFSDEDIKQDSIIRNFKDQLKDIQLKKINTNQRLSSYGYATENYQIFLGD